MFLRPQPRVAVHEVPAQELLGLPQPSRSEYRCASRPPSRPATMDEAADVQQANREV